MSALIHEKKWQLDYFLRTKIRAEFLALNPSRFKSTEDFDEDYIVNNDLSPSLVDY